MRIMTSFELKNTKASFLSGCFWHLLTELLTISAKTTNRQDLFCDFVTGDLSKILFEQKFNGGPLTKTVSSKTSRDFRGTAALLVYINISPASWRR
jgi:hypothetical protein